MEIERVKTTDKHNGKERVKQNDKHKQQKRK
jgi:hypothetical protein